MSHLQPTDPRMTRAVCTLRIVNALRTGRRRAGAREAVLRSCAAILLFFAAPLFFAASRSVAGLDPAQCSVVPSDALNGVICSPALPSPLNESVNTITVRNSSGSPIFDASVVVLLTAANPACPNAVLTGITNNDGVVVITISAKGCSDLIPSACVIKANGVTIRSYVNCKSPDFDGAAGDGVVNLSDLLAFAREFNGVTPPGCHDYTNDGQTNLSDLIPFGAAFSTAKHCP